MSSAARTTTTTSTTTTTTIKTKFGVVKLPLLTSDRSTWYGSSLLSSTQITYDGLDMLYNVADEMRRRCTCMANHHHHNHNNNNNDIKSGGDTTSDENNNISNHDHIDIDRILRHKVLGTLFYEASTRTSISFQVSMLRLGGTYVHVDGHDKSSSSAGMKGESLTDTIRCLQCYTDCIVLRHPITGSIYNVYETIYNKNKNNDGMNDDHHHHNDSVHTTTTTISSSSSSLPPPIINAGDGIDEHPTQALLDVYTIYDELQQQQQQQQTTKSSSTSSSTSSSLNTTTTTIRRRRRTLNIIMLGDLKHGRTVHSLAKLLSTVTSESWKAKQKQQHQQQKQQKQQSAEQQQEEDDDDDDDDTKPSSKSSSSSSSRHYDRLIIKYCSPIGLEMPQEIIDFCSSCNNSHNDDDDEIIIQQRSYHDIQAAMMDNNITNDDDGTTTNSTDVLYVTRIQRERFPSDDEYEHVRGSYRIDSTLLDQYCNNNNNDNASSSCSTSRMIIMHPLPRMDEIDPISMDTDPRSAYFRQMKNGMYIRMAILSLIVK